MAVTGTEFETTDQGLFESGLITSNAGWRGNDAERQPAGEFGAQHAFITRFRDNHSIVDDFGLNVKYRPNDSWSFNLDLQYVDSQSDVLDFSVMGATRAVVGIEQDGSAIPVIGLHDPLYSGASDHFVDPHNYFWRSAMDHISDNEGEEFAFAGDAQYTFDDGFFTEVKVGVRSAKREQITRQSTYNWGWLSEAWAGNGNAWFDAQGDELGASLSSSYDQITFDDFARGGVLDPAGANTFLFPNRDLVLNYANAESSFSPLSPGWGALASRGGAEGHFVPNEVNDTVEKTKPFTSKPTLKAG